MHSNPSTTASPFPQAELWFSSCIWVEKLYMSILMYLGVPWWLSDTESVCNAGDMGLIPGLGRSPREGNGNPFHILA